MRLQHCLNLLLTCTSIKPCSSLARKYMLTLHAPNGKLDAGVIGRGLTNWTFSSSLWCHDISSYLPAQLSLSFLLFILLLLLLPQLLLPLPPLLPPVSYCCVWFEDTPAYFNMARSKFEFEISRVRAMYETCRWTWRGFKKSPVACVLWHTGAGFMFWNTQLWIGTSNQELCQ